MRVLARGLIALQRERFDEVVELFAAIGDKNGQPERWWLIADAYEGLGQLDSATVFLHRIVAQAGVYEWDNIVAVGVFYPFVHRRLALLYAKLSRPDRAEEHYLTFLETFTQPDPEYAHMVTEALEALARGR